MEVICGIGMDIQSIRELEKTMERGGERFLAKVFTAHEIEYCRRHASPAQHFAARWAVKEAFFKAAGGMITRKYQFRDVELRHESSGRPYIQLYGDAACELEQHGVGLWTSLSHSGEYAAAQVIAVVQQKQGSAHS